MYLSMQKITNHEIRKPKYTKKICTITVYNLWILGFQKWKTGQFV